MSVHTSWSWPIRMLSLISPPAFFRASTGFKPKASGNDPKGKEIVERSKKIPGAPPSGSGGAPAARGKEKQIQVYLLKEGKPAAVPVKTGIANSSSIELLEGGLKEGDEVIVEQIGGDTKKKGGASPMGPRF